jgi:serine/threonine-protein kinase
VPETVRIPAGRLQPSDELRASIPIASFRLGRTPVTNREYSFFLARGGAREPPWWNDPDFRAPRQPVVGITWDEAVAYCAWLCQTVGGFWRLPDEAEWEFAVRGGLVGRATAWGDAVPSGEIPEGRLSGPWEVGRGTPNGYGMLDPGTIVHEWCRNWHEPGASDSRQGPAPPRRASRGGSWRHRIRWSSPGARSSLPPAYRYSDYGFRVLREER